MQIEILFQCPDCGAIEKPHTETYEGQSFMVCVHCGSAGGYFEEVPSDLSAELIVARLRRMTGAREGIEAQYKTVLESLKREKERAERRLDNFLAWSQPLLEAYYKAHPPRGKTKSIDIAGTKVGYRSVAASFALEDGADTKGSPDNLEQLHSALRWARENRPDLVKTEITLKWGDMKKSLQESQPEELPPGVKRTEAKEEFYVR